MDVTLQGISQDNIRHLMEINRAVLPVRYPDHHPMYRHILQAGELFSHVAFAQLRPGAELTPVGAVGCRLERASGAGYDDNDADAKEAPYDRVRLYVMTIAVLALYRRMGIGRMMMQRVLDNCERVNADPCAYGYRIESVYLNVQVGNDEALRFYESFGFQVRQVLEGYYTNVEPRDAYMLEKELKPAG